ncbi:MAG TPA: 3-isopropylmalate dehydratase large subunit [Candidatus Acidoferrum sp.]|nr:3-isopropylmalate dehydratase large subunit [Candidatus Acidoferrum sp.]
MAMTMTQKIMAAHAGVPAVSPGQLIMAKLDLVLGNDITLPIAATEFEKAGFTGIFDKDKVVVVFDHFVPNKDIASAEQCKLGRGFAMKQGIKNFFDVGEMGVEHALLPEKGLVAAGDMVIGADSHTCTYGALGAFSTGVGSTDMAAGMAAGQTWFRVPEAIRVTLTGKMGPYVSGKDVMLTLIGKIGVDGARYMSVEFAGDGIKNLTMDDRLSMANMGIECGAKNAIFPVDDVTRAYLDERVGQSYMAYEADPDALYAAEYTIDLGTIVPTVAFPHLPSNTRPASEAGDVKIDQVVIGSCTNGRISDMAAAAEIFKGRKVAKGVRALVIPATPKIYREAMKAGYIDIFMEAGCAVSTPTCGPCLGGYMGILADGERCVATTNRNFVGRMGHSGSEVYLASPATAAASAVAGRIVDPRQSMEVK